MSFRMFNTPVNSLFASAIIAAALTGGPAAAQEAFCVVQRAGQVQCMAEKLCVCRHYSSSEMSGAGDGYRWDCGALRPACGTAAPVTLNPYYGPLPSAVAIDKSTIHVDQLQSIAPDDAGAASD
jgi:hypothetical protein